MVNRVLLDNKIVREWLENSLDGLTGLDKFVADHLGPLDSIKLQSKDDLQGETLQDKVFYLVRQAEKEGWYDNLVFILRREYPAYYIERFPSYLCIKPMFISVLVAAMVHTEAGNIFKRVDVERALKELAGYNPALSPERLLNRYGETAEEWQPLLEKEEIKLSIRALVGDVITKYNNDVRLDDAGKLESRSDLNKTIVQIVPVFNGLDEIGEDEERVTEWARSYCCVLIVDAFSLFSDELARQLKLAWRLFAERDLATIFFQYPLFPWQMPQVCEHFEGLLEAHEHIKKDYDQRTGDYEWNHAYDIGGEYGFRRWLLSKLFKLAPRDVSIVDRAMQDKLYKKSEETERVSSSEASPQLCS